MGNSSGVNATLKQVEKLFKSYMDAMSRRDTLFVEILE
jgi:hypothetical protein